MRIDWDRRAVDNARYYIAIDKTEWTDDEFYASGQRTVSDFILNDMTNVCQGQDPQAMRVLEIGCGAGRVTRALAGIFGEVHGVDVSGEMVRLARDALAPYKNARVYRNNGMDLSVLPNIVFDHVFSTIVFQHIPSRGVIRKYFTEAHRVLKPGGLFKVEVQGARIDCRLVNTWVGVTISPQDAQELADASGFEMRYQYGANTQNYWLWLFKRALST